MFSARGAPLSLASLPRHPQTPQRSTTARGTIVGVSRVTVRLEACRGAARPRDVRESKSVVRPPAVQNAAMHNVIDA
eukprot:1548146-Prymnesium_polylepis.2